MKRYAVIGNPIDHSLSPVIHSMFAEQTGQAIEYGKLFSEVQAFQETVARFFAAGGSGLNVTVPFKGQAFDWVTHVESDARQAQAVNTIVPFENGFRGYNTDGVGLVRDLGRLGIAISGRRVLVLGAGGAVRGVLAAILRERPAELVVANRTVAKAQALAEIFQGVSAVALSNLSGSCDICINATSAGLAGQSLAIPEEIIQGAVCYDMTYGDKAQFHRRCRESGFTAHDGLGMLVEQAAEAFYLWTGMRPETSPVLRRLQDG